MEKVLCLITNRNLAKKEFFKGIEEALLGGVDVVQLREKDLMEAEILELAEKLRGLTYKYGKRLIINHFPRVAAAVDADGVHLGQGAYSIGEVREIVGEQKIIGVSTHNLNEAIKAWQEGADYLMVSHIFPTDCKAGLRSKGIGLLKEIKAYTADNIPLIALGGINRSNVQVLLQNSFNNVAVMSGIMADDEPGERTRELKSIMNSLNSTTHQKNT